MDSIESQWKVKELENYLLETYTINTNLYEDVSEDKKLIPESIATKIESIALEKYQNKYQEIGDNRLLLEKQVMLQVLDVHWKEHLAEIDHLRNSIGLRAYAQKNPKNEFKKEAYSMFESMLDEIDSGTVRILFSLQIAEDSNSSHLIHDEKNKEMTLEKEIAPNFVSNEPNTQENLVQKSSKNLQRETLKIGRNELVKITKGDETKEMKYKKAKLLIENDGWTII
jgi:preprotein translocase subunit SecA